MYVGLTNNHNTYPDHILATNDSHKEARFEAAWDFFFNEFNMQEHQFQIEKVAYMTDYDKATMIVTMCDDKYVTKAIIRKAAVRNTAKKK